jgi:hypothetical protein
MTEYVNDELDNPFTDEESAEQLQRIKENRRIIEIMDERPVLRNHILTWYPFPRKGKKD